LHSKPSSRADWRIQHSRGGQRLELRLEFGSALYPLCDLGQVTQLWKVKIIVLTSLSCGEN
jgi:hypothetical protein